MQMMNYLRIAAILAISTLMVSCLDGKGGSRGAAGTSFQTTERSNTQGRTEVESNNSAIPADTSVVTPPLLSSPIVNVYLENSGSMNGYVDQGQTLFQQDVFNYLCDIHISDIASEMNLFYINSQIIDKGSVIDTFINNLSPSSFQTSGGSTATTNLSDIFKQILNRTDDNTLSVFISDCIFSPGNVNSPEAYLAGEQVGIKKCFADHLQKHPNFTALVYQLYSNFDGVYYDYRNRRQQYSGDRPYYIWVLGHTANVAKLRALIPNEKFSGSGVANMWCATNYVVDNATYSISPKAVKGDFKRKGNHSLARIKKTNGDFAFRVTANLEELVLLLGNDYLMDSNNYSRIINKYVTDDWYIGIERNTNPQSPATHNFTLGTKQNITSGNLCVAICCKSPGWAYEYTDEDDSILTSENNRKTYGLKYMIDGVQQAFEAKTSGVYMVMDFKLN